MTEQRDRDDTSKDSTSEETNDDSTTTTDDTPDTERGVTDDETSGTHRARVEEAEHDTDVARHDQYGGFNLGAAFFGWLVAVAMAVLLASIVGAIAAAVGSSLNVDRSDAERQAGTFGIATAVALLVILMLAYYAGGYVAGRMSRYDGGRQGLGVWLIGLIVTALAVGLGAIFGQQYDVMNRVDLPTIPIPTDVLTWGGIVALAAVLVGTFLTAFLGGKVGQRYHRKIDRVTA